MIKTRNFKVACVQATPVIFNLEKSLDKIIAFAGQAVQTGDFSGHYSHDDIFVLKVKDQPGIEMV